MKRLGREQINSLISTDYKLYESPDFRPRQVMAIENLRGLSRPKARKALHLGCTSPRILSLRSSLSTISCWRPSAETKSYSEKMANDAHFPLSSALFQDQRCTIQSVPNLLTVILRSNSHTEVKPL